MTAGQLVAAIVGLLALILAAISGLCRLSRDPEAPALARTLDTGAGLLATLALAALVAF